MGQIRGETLTTETGRQCVVDRLLGFGGQGEVYHVQVDGQPLALKWYDGRPHLTPGVRCTE